MGGEREEGNEGGGVRGCGERVMRGRGEECGKEAGNEGEG